MTKWWWKLWKFFRITLFIESKFVHNSIFIEKSIVWTVVVHSSLIISVQVKVYNFSVSEAFKKHQLLSLSFDLNRSRIFKKSEMVNYLGSLEIPHKRGIAPYSHEKHIFLGTLGGHCPINTYHQLFLRWKYTLYGVMFTGFWFAWSAQWDYYYVVPFGNWRSRCWDPPNDLEM